MPPSMFEIGQYVSSGDQGMGIVTDKDYRNELALPGTVGRARIVGNANLEWFYKVAGDRFNPLQWYRETSLDAAQY